LSHAYYQLSQTGAIVEAVHPFIGFEERHAFNKLVRDNIPNLILQRGESVTTAVLESEALITALKEKLVEEAYELLDAKNLQSITAELADIREVIDALIKKTESFRRSFESGASN
jgi:predicted house-cleaning noncanonical NTP pyrophosphatase (MazG superfamily)